ncbi:MAG: pyruvate carboxylase [Planctomycetaceae bacterium]|nr:pyruvate carboxylase [Planctomycetaceae bacterium]
MRQFRKLLVANRGEIAIRVLRTAHELGIRTVAIYSHEDRYALHRFKADEAYLVGKAGEPLRAYLDIDGMIAVAKRYEIDAIHPGYGFLSENPDFAQACLDAGITFVGPSGKILEQLGDKTAAREIARIANVAILAGTAKSVRHLDDARRAIERLGYPVILKAAKGGGGRGMRVVLAAKDLAGALEQAQRESQTAFGSNEVFVEKYISRARHIEVQLLGDAHGHLVHLFERDCSLQRRHQKVVEIAPSPNLDPALRDRICAAALAVGRAVNYQNAGTVEFLVDAESSEFYFIEVNPRIQVEHTVTEEVTGLDLIKCQILVAQGVPLSDPEIGLGAQSAVQTRGYAIQCRVTTEDPSNNFMPDYGRITHYRSASGMGIRLDAGTAFSGAVVTPFYDSLLVKVIAKGLRFVDAAKRMERCLQEFRVRGVKTNIPFLLNLITHPTFLDGSCTTKFLDETPSLFQFIQRKDRATKLLKFLGDVIVNGNALVSSKPAKIPHTPAPVPAVDATQPIPPGMRQKLKELGAEKFSRWIRDHKPLLVTDTTFRDAHQSLLATRMRTYDMLRVADAYARHCPQLFSLEMWGGATFDTSMRFLKECPWQRLTQMRERVPNILFQMLLRASNAVGYTNYPDNVVEAFVKEAAGAGIDVFRIFDALNWVPNMRVAIDAVLESGAICEAAICYTGDILNPQRPKYNLDYYVDLAKELEKMGAHILAIKDMAGLCKPYAAELLVKTLKQEIGIPIHFHSHDMSGVQGASILKAAEVGLDIADGALAPLSGLTSQPNLNSLVEALRHRPRETGVDPEKLKSLAYYWEAVRKFYAPFETGMVAGDVDIYLHEMPGGQATNLYQQAASLGLANRWADLCRTYADVNLLFGDIVKVTPTSKSVGDMALFLLANNLKAEDVLDPSRDFAFPESVVDLIAGRMGQPPGGFPSQVKKRILRDVKPVKGRPGASLPPADFAATEKLLKRKLHRPPTSKEVVSHLLYPRVFEEFAAHQEAYSDVSVLPTSTFLYGHEPGDEVAIDIEEGKTLILKFLTVGDPHPDGHRTVFYELNGQPREVNVIDRSLEPQEVARPKADPADPQQVAAPMPGLVVTVGVLVGDKVTEGQKLVTMEAMKMETTLYAETEGRVAELFIKPGTQVETGELLLKLERP